MKDADSSAAVSSAFMQKLNERGFGLMILRDGRLLLESQREGMKPLLMALKNFGRTSLRGTVVVDKIVGKAAALLISYFQPKEVYCGTLSQRAEAVFQRYRLTYHAARVVPEILCRTGDDLCPFEKAVLDSETPVNGYRELMLKVLSFSS
jgi:hypothetical protein